MVTEKIGVLQNPAWVECTVAFTGRWRHSFNPESISLSNNRNTVNIYGVLLDPNSDPPEILTIIEYTGDKRTLEKIKRDLKSYVGMFS